MTNSRNSELPSVELTKALVSLKEAKQKNDFGILRSAFETINKTILESFADMKPEDLNIATLLASADAAHKMREEDETELERVAEESEQPDPTTD